MTESEKSAVLAVVSQHLDVANSAIDAYYKRRVRRVYGTGIVGGIVGGIVFSYVADHSFSVLPFVKGALPSALILTIMAANEPDTTVASFGSKLRDALLSYIEARNLYRKEVWKLLYDKLWAQPVASRFPDPHSVFRSATDSLSDSVATATQRARSESEDTASHPPPAPQPSPSPTIFGTVVDEVIRMFTRWFIRGGWRAFFRLAVLAIIFGTIYYLFYRH